MRCAYVGLRVYWCVARPTVVGVKCVVANDDDVLLVRHTYGRRVWDFPGGTVRRRELPIDAARREMHEELGRRIEDWEELGALHAARPPPSRQPPRVPGQHRRSGASTSI